MGLDVDSIVRFNLYEESPFWKDMNGSDYALLNTINPPDNPTILDAQRQAAQGLIKGSSNAHFSALDSLFQGGNNISAELVKANADFEKRILEIVTKFNSLTYYSSKSFADGGDANEKAFKSVQTRMRKLQDLLIQFNNQYSLSSEEGFTGNLLTNLNRAIGDTFGSTNNISNFLKQLNDYKGGYLEEAGTAFIKSLGLPDIFSIRVGNVSVQGSEIRGMNGQLIQDILIYSMQGSDLDKTIINWKGIDGRDYRGTISAFFAAVEAASGKSKMITIDESAYTSVLENIQQIGIQAKSGKKQKMFNTNWRTAVSLSDLGGGSYKTALELLSSLYKISLTDQNFSIAETNENYNALFNYCLSTNLNHILSIGEKQNTYILTPFGFKSYGERLLELFNQGLPIIQLASKFNLSEPDIAYKVAQSNMDLFS